MNRIQSVDTFRFIAILAIIAIHTSPYAQYKPNPNELYKYINVLIDIVSRFSVPFFFIISGYFYGLKIRENSCPIAASIKSIKRLIFLFLIWSIIYLIPYKFQDIYNHKIDLIIIDYWQIISKLSEHPITLMMEGTKAHLWFLIALSFSLAISSIFIKFSQNKLLILISIALYILAICAKAYIKTPIGINIDFDTRNGPFFGTIFFVTGYIISKYPPSIKWLKYGIFMYIFGLLISLYENHILWKNYAMPASQDFVFGTYFMGLGIALASLSNHSILRSSLMSKIGQQTLGIYLIHNLFVDLLKPLNLYLGSSLWEVSKILVVFLLSFSTIFIISKMKYINKIIT